MFLLLALCLFHAWFRRREAISYIAGGFLFGVLLEYLEVASHSYVYGRFHVMVGRAPLDVPVCIGAGWGIILYTARLFSDAFALPVLSAAAVDTLLALNIDLSMDAVAYRLHMWHWFWDDPGRALTSQWFGIPYGNFIGWVTVVFCYSGFTRLFEQLLLRRVPDGFRIRSLIALFALLCSLTILFGSEDLLYPFLLRFGITSGVRLSIFVLLLLMIVARGWRRRHGRMAPLPQIAVWVPCWFHLFFAICFFALGFYRESRWLTSVALVNIVAGTAIHLVPRRAVTLRHDPTPV